MSKIAMLLELLRLLQIPAHGLVLLSFQLHVGLVTGKQMLEIVSERFTQAVCLLTPT